MVDLQTNKSNNSAYIDKLIAKFSSVRSETINICSPLEIEDYVVQPCPEVSPPKWHLGHTTWFFEELILRRFYKGFQRYNDIYRTIFNSYYKSLGSHWLQGERGHLSRPTVKQTFEYRLFVNESIIRFLNSGNVDPEAIFLLELGINHEQQHQELLLMDIKYILGLNPLFPVYDKNISKATIAINKTWENFAEGIYEVGHQGSSFSYDNEGPKHKTYIHPFEISNKLISNGEYLAFIEDEGYSNPKFWLSEGWEWLKESKTSCPLYWSLKDKSWYEFTLHGLRPLDLDEPVVHISYFEASAFAKWSDGRLPTEYEMEVYLNKDEEILSHAGQAWCWTSSQYSPYPGYKEYSGAIGEYNGKFMCNQFVLKGGSNFTPQEHYRNTYRNFYQAHERWMLSGVRLAKDL
jgi:ergothioneine biosynthesis protein EgtB